MFQCRKILHASEVGDSHFTNLNASHRSDFIRCQDIVIRCVKVLVNVGAEGLVGEVFLADLHIALRRRCGQRNGKCSIREMQQGHAAHRQRRCKRQGSFQFTFHASTSFLDLFFCDFAIIFCRVASTACQLTAVI